MHTPAIPGETRWPLLADMQIVKWTPAYQRAETFRHAGGPARAFTAQWGLD